MALHMRRRIKIFNDIREDISDYLFHFTKGEDAFLTLEQIIADEAIKDVKNNGYICFTETPIYMLERYFKFIAKQYKVAKILAPYGIGIRRDWLFNKGARPVIYGLPEEKSVLPESMQWRFVSVNPPCVDWLWLREWRINIQEIRFRPEDIVIITNTEDEQILFWKIVVDNPYDETLDDSMIDSRQVYRAISIERLPELNTKAKIKEYLSEQAKLIEEEK
jgi:hypothetical protein